MSERVPQLLIIAGPNGAGKSTYSKDLSHEGAVIFDADKEIAILEAKFPGLPSDSVFYGLQQVFSEQVELALQRRIDLTIENNFRDNSLLDIIERFRSKGYEVGMVYLLLSSIAQSKDRVAVRVKNGGHFISNNDIMINYTEGLKNLVFFASRFNHLELIDASGNYLSLRPLLSIRSGILNFHATNMPSWAEQTVRAVAQ